MQKVYGVNGKEMKRDKSSSSGRTEKLKSSRGNAISRVGSIVCAWGVLRSELFEAFVAVVLVMLLMRSLQLHRYTATLFKRVNTRLRMM